MSRIVRLLEPHDFDCGFIETLRSLAPVELTPLAALMLHLERQSNGVRTWVIESDGGVVATGSLLIEKKFVHSGGIVGHIEDVAVRRDRTGQGLGSQVIEHLTAEATKAGCYKVILNCQDHLIPFYERLGYRRHDAGMRHNCLERDIARPGASSATIANPGYAIASIASGS